MTQLEMEVLEDGTVVIPPELYRAMGWQIGEKLIVQVKDCEMRIFSQTQAIQRAQAWVKSFVPSERSLSDELVAERRSEHLHE